MVGSSSSDSTGLSSTCVITAPTIMVSESRALSAPQPGPLVRTACYDSGDHWLPYAQSSRYVIGHECDAKTRSNGTHVISSGKCRIATVYNRRLFRLSPSAVMGPGKSMPPAFVSQCARLFRVHSEVDRGIAPRDEKQDAGFWVKLVDKVFEVLDVANRLPIHFSNNIPGLQTSLIGWRVRLDLAHGHTGFLPTLSPLPVTQRLNRDPCKGVFTVPAARFTT